MTAHAHDPSTHLAHDRDGPAPAAPAATKATRPRWLLPAVVAGIIVVALVAFGVLSPSAVLYGGLFGGMLLMHLGGHGGHGGHAKGERPDRSSVERPTEGTGQDDDRQAGHPCH